MSVRHEEQHPDSLLLADLERLGEQIPGGFFVYRAEEPQEMLFVNRNVLRIFGCDTLEEYKALTGYTFRGLVHPEDFDSIQSSIDEQIADTANDNLDYVEYRIVRKDGEVRWIDDYGHYTHTDDYGGVYYVFISDITDKRHAQEERFRAELELEREKRANEIRSGLLAGISHDIRSPMRTIEEFTRQAKTHLYEPHQLRGDLENVDAAGQRLERLVDSLLDMSSAEFGRSDVRPEPCSLAAQARDAIDLFRARAGAKNLTLSEALDLPEENVLADAQRLRTVLCNLISNAVSFTPEGGSVKVSASRRQESDAGYAQFEFTVSDTGVGMSEEFLRRVYDALENGSADIGGGHGLAVAKKLLATMGGSMTIRSRAGQGTSVTVSLPLQLAAHNRRVQFESVFDLFSLFGNGDPVYLFDFHTQTARFSPALLETLGTPDAQSSGANGIYFWADHIHPDDRERFMRTIWDANELRRISFDLKCRMRVRGVYYPVRFLGGVTKDADGHPDFLGLIMKNDGLSDLTDPVTGLPSRHRFLLALQEGAKSILLLRVGRLEKVNADYGYSRGNEVLRRVAQCLRDAVGGSGTVYRLDGAAFAVLSDRLGQAEIQELYENLRDALYRVIETDGVTHRLLASGGLLLRAEKPSLNEQEVCDCLARACAESEQNRQGELVVFCEAGAKKPAELAVTREIRRCMAKDFEHFFLLYQPVYDRDTGRPVGAEALLRWKHAQYGELTPARFLADVEWESRFRELGCWVLRGAMMDGRLFLNADPDFTVCVNLSPGQITDACFAETAAELAAQAGFPLDRLCLELHGDCRRLPTEQLRRFAAPLRALGVRIGIDDYGSGDAWFDALRSMDFDYVKFSSEFARSAAKDETGLSAVRYLAELARAHHAEVYVKAIESEAMADALRGLPVRGVQGRCFSDCLYFDDVLDLIEARKTTV